MPVSTAQSTDQSGKQAAVRTSALDEAPAGANTAAPVESSSAPPDRSPVDIHTLL
jgi:hypothetical protein